MYLTSENRQRFKLAKVSRYTVCSISPHTTTIFVVLAGNTFFLLPFAFIAEGEFFDPPDRETVRLQKFGKLLAGPNTDLGNWFVIQLYCVIDGVGKYRCPHLLLCRPSNFPF